MMQNKPFFKSIWALVVLSLIIFNYQPGLAQDTTVISPDECVHYGTVFDYSGIDGCGFVILKDDGEMLEVVGIVPNIILKDSMRIIFGYTPLRVLTACMVGQPVRVDCIEVLPHEICRAGFNYEKIRCEPWDSRGRCGPLGYAFFDKSIGNVAKYYWNFGDGYTSEKANPEHIFKEAGIYEVCLEIFTADSCYDKVCLSIAVGDSTECQALFEYYPIDYLMNPNSVEPFWPMPGYHYQFYDRSIGDVKSRIWFINGDSIFDDPNPMYTFHEPGIYAATLYIETTSGCTSWYSDSIIIDGPQECKAMFEYYHADSLPWIVRSSLGTSIQFRDLSYGDIIDWYWDFGDGTTSSEQNPKHYYNIPGTYNVCLIVASDDGCEDKICLDVVADYPHDCKAYFEYCEYHLSYPDSSIVYDTLMIDITWPDGPWYIGFKNLSVPNNSECFWDFGDGSYSTEKNPVHVYRTPGLYDVRLVITASDGCQDVYKTKVKAGYIPCDVDFTYQIVYPDCDGFEPGYMFIPITTQNIWEYYWDFGDGEYSYDAKPIHIFDSYGSYEVCLDVFVPGGCNATKCHTIWVSRSEMDSVFIEKCGTTALQNLKYNSSMSVTNAFPNPASDNFNLIIESNKTQTVSISLVNVLGQMFDLESSYLLGEGENQVSIQTHLLQAGNYYYIITGNEHIVRGTISIID